MLHQASETVNVKSTDLVQSVRDGATVPYDVTIECSGVDACIGMCIRCTRSGGKCVLVGIGASAEATIPLADATGREVDLIGVFRYCNLYQASVDMVSAGLVDVRSLISHHFSLEGTADAFRTALQGGDAIKARGRGSGERGGPGRETTKSDREERAKRRELVCGKNPTGVRRTALQIACIATRHESCSVSLTRLVTFSAGADPSERSAGWSSRGCGEETRPRFREWRAPVRMLRLC